VQSHRWYSPFWVSLFLVESSALARGLHSPAHLASSASSSHKLNTNVKKDDQLVGESESIPISRFCSLDILLQTRSPGQTAARINLCSAMALKAGWSHTLLCPCLHLPRELQACRDYQPK